MIDELVEGVIAMANGAYFTHILRHDQRSTVPFGLVSRPFSVPTNHPRPAVTC